MRIEILGDCESAEVLRQQLDENGILSLLPQYKIELVELDHDPANQQTIVESVDSDLERQILLELREMGVGQILLKGPSVDSDSIKFQFDRNLSIPIVRSILVSVLKLTADEKKPESREPKLPWWKRVITSLFILLSLSGRTEAQLQYPIVRFWDGANIVNGGDLANNAIRVNCVVGCGAGGGEGGATEATLQTILTTSAFQARINTLGQKTSANSTPVVLSSDQSAIPVTGTFWQATQPVSGTVTANAGSGTFTISGTVTANAGTGTLAVSGPLTDSQLRASAVPVSGTFWQATQPVSGTVAATQSGTWNVNTAPQTTATAANDGSCVSLTTTSATIVPSNSSRKFLTLYLRGTATDIVFIKLGATATTSDLPLEIGQAFTIPANYVYTGVIDGRSNTGTQSVCFVEL